MKRRLALLFYYNDTNRYSVNALAGALETQGFSSGPEEICFTSCRDGLFQKVERLLNEYEVVVVGSTFFSTQIGVVRELMGALRAGYQQRVMCLAGGPHPSGDPEGTLAMGFDLVVRGEGEGTLIELLERIVRGEEYRTVRGLSFLDEEGRVCFTGSRPALDLDSFFPFAFRHKMVGPLEITRGCPWGCGFCQTPHLFGSQVRHRSVEFICHTVKALKKRGLMDMRFITPNAFSYGSGDGRTLAIDSLEELLSSLRKVLYPRGRIFFGTFPSEVRPEHVTGETLRLVSEYADNDNLVIGAQSGSQRILNLCHRGHTVADVYQAVERTLNAGFKANVDFIFGLPGEEEEDRALTVAMIEDLVAMGARIHAHTFMPLPQTAFARSPGGRVPQTISRVLNRLVPRGVVFGGWVHQERMAKTMEYTC